MENHRHLIIVALCLLPTNLALGAPAAFADQATVLLGPQIISLLEGKTLKGVYADGSPVQETYAVGGKIPDYVDNYQSSTGTWSVVNNQLCTFYDSKMAGGCFRVEKLNDNCFDYFVMASSVEEALAPQERPRYTARAHIQGVADTCPSDLTT